jgi:AcrR family transcriptional regulator
MSCFARRGFHQTTMNDISAEAQISVGLIYRYWTARRPYLFHGRRAKDLGQIEAAKAAPSLFEALEIVFTCHCEERPSTCTRRS